MAGQPGFFDLSDRYAALSAAADPLERLASAVHLEVFRGPLIAALRRSNRGKGARPLFDPVVLFIRTIGIARARIKIGMANLA